VYNLLICTVGGSPEPIVAALKCWTPQRIRFIITPESGDHITSKILPLAQTENIQLEPGRYDLLQLSNSQDFAACVDSLRQLTPAVEEWLSRGNDYRVVVDITGGTKCMSAALALQAHRWCCIFSYVGGTARTKDGVGVVVSGKEQILQTLNPWDSLGFQAIEEFVSLFNQRAFSAASAMADQALRNVSEHSRKRELQALRMLSDAYDAWDRFDRKAAISKFQELAKYDNDVHAVLGRLKAGRVRDCINNHISYLRALVESGSPSKQQIIDLLANARRRKSDGRVDDAVARLYRVIESIAQLALNENYQIANTKQVPLDLVPEPLRSLWAGRAEMGTVFAGLKDAYELLDAYGDRLGAKFKELQLHNRERSPLVSRNQSILAHGFDPVGDKVYQLLWDAALQLSQITETELPEFPQITGG